MRIFHAAVIVLAALAYGYAATLNFVGAESVKVEHRKESEDQREWESRASGRKVRSARITPTVAIPSLGLLELARSSKSTTANR